MTFGFLSLHLNKHHFSRFGFSSWIDGLSFDLKNLDLYLQTLPLPGTASIPQQSAPTVC